MRVKGPRPDVTVYRTCTALGYSLNKILDTYPELTEEQANEVEMLREAVFKMEQFIINGNRTKPLFRDRLVLYDERDFQDIGFLI